MEKARFPAAVLPEGNLHSTAWQLAIKTCNFKREDVQQWNNSTLVPVPLSSQDVSLKLTKNHGTAWLYMTSLEEQDSFLQAPISKDWWHQAALATFNYMDNDTFLAETVENVSMCICLHSFMRSRTKSTWLLLISEEKKTKTKRTQKTPQNQKATSRQNSLCTQPSS